jgi:hypothetical protein
MAKRTLLFDIFGLTILACGVQYRAVPRGWFAIWFANSTLQTTLHMLAKRQGASLQRLYPLADAASSARSQW